MIPTKIITRDGLNEAGKIIRDGGLVAFPTETVYGLGASAFDARAVKKIYAAKGRPSDNPLIVHISDKAQIPELAREISPMAQRLIDSFMPGPFTIILKKKDCIPDAVTAGLDTVGIRFPKNELAADFIAAAGVPIAAPSANLSGKPSPTKAIHVINDMTGRIEGIIDGGVCDVGVESTIVDASGDVPVLLRPGGVTLDMLRAVVAETVADEHILSSVSENEQPKCPGMKYRHYAPNAEVVVVEGNKDSVQKKIRELLDENSGKSAGVLTMFDSAYDNAVILSAGRDNKTYARKLFAALRSFDELGVELVFAEFSDDNNGYGLAVKNRLYKAAGNNVIYV